MFRLVCVSATAKLYHKAIWSNSFNADSVNMVLQIILKLLKGLMRSDFDGSSTLSQISEVRFKRTAACLHDDAKP